MPKCLWVPVALLGKVRALVLSEYEVSGEAETSDSSAPNRARSIVTADNVIGDYRLDGQDAAR